MICLPVQVSAQPETPAQQVRQLEVLPLPTLVPALESARAVAQLPWLAPAVAGQHAGQEASLCALHAACLPVLWQLLSCRPPGLWQAPMPGC